ncbi:LOW QUALITY PROTEIN: mannitol-1-phosphate 5-dehydrogenase, partial [Escherichia coli M605]
SGVVGSDPPGDGRVGRIRRSRRIRHRAQMPDATLTRLIMPTGLNRRSDKALAPHPTPCADA